MSASQPSFRERHGAVLLFWAWNLGVLCVVGLFAYIFKAL